MAAGTDPHRVVPASGRHSPPPLRAVIADALATGAAVVDGEARGELPLTLAADVDVLVGDPVGRACRVLHQAWTHKSAAVSRVYSSRNTFDGGADVVLTQRYVNGTNHGS